MVSTQRHSKAITFEAGHFPTPLLVLGTNAPEDHRAAGRFAHWMADQANALLKVLDWPLGLAAEERSVELDRLFHYVQRCRAAREEVTKRTKFLRLIPPGDPNYDPFGVIEGKKAGGLPTPEFCTRVAIGSLINSRFSALPHDAEVLQNTVAVPGEPPISGTILHRGASARAIDELKGLKYGYATNAQMFITETASPQDRARLHKHGVRILGELAAGTSMLAANDQRGAFALGLYCLFQGPLFNRGSDSTIRIFGTALYARTVGLACPLPHDVDVRAYAHEQAHFTEWLGEALSEC